MDPQLRRSYNEKFLQRLLARRPQDRDHYQALLAQPETPALEFAAPGAPSGRDLALETIVDRERPVLFVRDGALDTTEVTILGPEATDLVDRLKTASPKLLPLLPLIGRIDVLNFPGADFLGTGWFIDTNIVVTNRHVASLIARWDGRQFVFIRGIANRPIAPSLCNAHEFDDLAPDSSRIFKVKEVLYIEPESGPNDIAFLRVERRTTGNAPPFIPVASADAPDDLPVCVIGYPARAPKRIIPDQDLMNDLFRGRFDVKRVAPGFTSGIAGTSSTHDCSTLGGNSGSVLVDLATGRAVGLHFAGVYKENNFAVRASVLNDYVRRKRWNRPPEIEQRPPAPQATAVTVPVPSAGSVTVTVPLTITFSLGQPATPAPARVDAFRAEDAAIDFWHARPEGVVAVRVGYLDDGDRIGDQPCIAASVTPSLWAQFEATGPEDFQGVPIRYLPADIDEQVRSRPDLESVDSISYDDDARTAERFSFSPIEEKMQIKLHVGPEYSWDVLKSFLAGAGGRLVSAMYEFHGDHIKDVIEDRLRAGTSLSLVLDNASFSKVRNPEDEFDRVAVFEEWANHFTFDRIVAPEGKAGLISDSYHIKVTVRDDNTFWLSSGNWKKGSSQPVITQDQRDNAAEEDLPGNREWHVVVRNETLATRFRSHILQDAKRSADLGAGHLPRRLMEEETFVDIPIEEAVVLERRPPSRILEPKDINRTVRVQPLLTPDREGAVYSDAVLGLIESAQSSLLFQIPYIAMPISPSENRGFIDQLLRALTRKLKTLGDARVILRSGGQKFSSPSHAAWYFKSKGVDIESRLRVIQDHHTKGMIVDGRRVLLGSHNWSKPGVTLNRDASLLFDDAEIATYYAEAFEIDWARANRIQPKKYVKPEAIVREAVGDAPPPGFRRVRLADLLKED